MIKSQIIQQANRINLKESALMEYDYTNNNLSGAYNCATQPFYIGLYMRTHVPLLINTIGLNYMHSLIRADPKNRVNEGGNDIMASDSKPIMGVWG